MKRDSGSTPDRATTPQSGVVHESHGADRQSPNSFVSSPSMTIKEMKPCPFCEAPIRKLGVLDGSGFYGFHPENDCVLSSCHVAPDKIAKWNTRSSPEAVTDEMIEVLTESREAIRSLDEAALGSFVDPHTGCPIYPLRDELLSKLDAALLKVAL